MGGMTATDGMGTSNGASGDKGGQSMLGRTDDVGGRGMDVGMACRTLTITLRILLKVTLMLVLIILRTCLIVTPRTTTILRTRLKVTPRTTIITLRTHHKAIPTVNHIHCPTHPKLPTAKKREGVGTMGAAHGTGKRRNTMEALARGRTGLVAGQARWGPPNSLFFFLS